MEYYAPARSVQAGFQAILHGLDFNEGLRPSLRILRPFRAAIQFYFFQQRAGPLLDDYALRGY